MGLVSLYLPGVSALDVAGLNHGSYVGAVSAGVGPYGPTGIWTGATGYISVPDSPSLLFAGDSAIVVTYNVADFANYRELVGKTNGSTPASFDCYLASGSGGLAYLTAASGGGYNYIDASAPATGVRQQSVMNMFGGAAGIYLNGILNSASMGYPARPGVAGYPMLIGTRGDLFCQFKGSMDAVHIYNRGLSASEVAWINAEPYAMLRPAKRRIFTGSVPYIHSPGALVAATATGSLTTTSQLAANAVGASTATATLATATSLTSTTAATAAASATLSTSVALSAASGGASAATGALTTTTAFSASVGAAATAFGALGTGVALSGSAAATDASSAALQTAAGMVGTALGLALASGSLTLGNAAAALAAAAQGRTQANGTLSTTTMLSGSAWGVVLASGLLSHDFVPALACYTIKALPISRMASAQTITRLAVTLSISRNATALPTVRLARAK